MGFSRTEALTLQFYQWEQRCRGWELYNHPVYPEPPFTPFHYYTDLDFTQHDDGLHPTLFGKFLNLFKSSKEEKTRNEYVPLPSVFTHEEEHLIIYLIKTPKSADTSMQSMEQLLTMLSYTNEPLSFEIIANHERITLQIVCREIDSDYVYSQLSAFFPEVGIEKTDDIDSLDAILKPNSAYGFVDFGLSEEAMLPLKTFQKNDIDPYTGLFGILDNLDENQHTAIQIIFQGVQNSWAESILRSVSTATGEPFFANAPEMLPLAQGKIASPLFGVVIRVIGQDTEISKAKQLAHQIGAILITISNSGHNKLIPLSGADYEDGEVLDDVFFRQTRRAGMLFNVKELVSLAHIPQTTIRTIKLDREVKASHPIANTKRTSSEANPSTQPLILGNNSHRGRTNGVAVEQNHRLKHTHIIGATGTGKSTFLINLLSQDIENGNGFCVIDPHGDLIESVLAYIPEERFSDVILIDPSDTEYPIGLNILTAHTDIEKEILSSDLVGIFKRLSTSWGDQMNSVLGNAILAFLESTEVATLIDLRRFLIEKEYRNNFLKTVKDLNTLYYWQHEYPLLKTNSIGSILTRLDSFLRPKPIRYMVAQPKSLDFEHILDSGKILLVKLSQGMIGNDNSYLLGSFIVTKIQQAAMARQEKQQSERNNFFLYIDEFQNFITPSMSAILSGARKYHLGLVLAHQDMQQISTYDNELAGSILSNPGTRICFRLGDIDAKKLESGFTHFTAQDLQNLDTGEAIGRIESPNKDFNLSVTPKPIPDEGNAKERIERIKKLSQTTYGTSKEEVERIFEVVYRETQQAKKATFQEPIPKERPQKEILDIRPIIEREIDKTTKSIPKDQSKEIDEETAKKAIVHKSETQHRYLQTYIKRMAEARGYRALIEAPTPDGKGRVDILLEKNSITIACEISVTTPSQWEVQNIQKCIDGGYTVVVSLSTDKKALQNIKQKVEQEIQNDKVTILYLDPESFISYLDTQAAKEATTETRMKGYRVKVEYNSVSGEDAKHKREGLLRTIAQSIQKSS